MDLSSEMGGIAILAAIARLGSISAAAKAAGLSVSTAARRLDGLEARLHLRLVDRRTNGARLTQDGQRLAALALPLADQLAEIARAADVLRHGTGPTLVRVSGTETIIADILAPALPRLWATAPDVTVQLQSQNSIVSLAGRDAELAVRMVRPRGDSLLIRQLPPQPIGLYASPAWLAGRDPAAIDLKAAPILAYDDSFGPLPELAWLDALGLTQAIALRTGSTRALVTATRAGAGVGIVPLRFAAGLVAIPMPQPPPLRIPWLTVHRDLRRLPQVAAVHRWIIAAFEAGASQAAASD
ncbi:LysR family transcriptional regulator [Novosphingobium sp. PASSN1]|uniref:LysR family transcriptional regulator n=1 Tax=Novosphingobium sp. PASSN1 TaxID=2015561 RepID=UPI0025D765B2|nr:LysR family transcriptional regulator [Novosphingobium sp. PASSN1]